MSTEVTPARIQVVIKLRTGENIILEVAPTATVDDLKALIEEKLGVHPNRQRLLLDRKPLVSGSTLAEYGVEEGSELHLAIRLVD